MALTMGSTVANVLVTAILFVTTAKSDRTNGQPLQHHQAHGDLSLDDVGYANPRLETNKLQAPLQSVQSRKRALLQTTLATNLQDVVCELEEGLIQRLLAEKSRTWVIDDAAYRELEGEIQSVIDCTDTGDTILFDVTSVIRPTTQIVVSWDLTLSSVVPETGRVNDIFPEAEKRQTFTCPEVDVGVFRIRSQVSVVLANLNFEECSLKNGGGIVEVAPCSGGEASGRLQIHHVSFRDHQLVDTPCLNMPAPSCSSLELSDVTFRRNTCSGICGGLLPVSARLHDVWIRRNAQTSIDHSSPFFFMAPRGSRIVMESVVANLNQGTVLRVEESEVIVRESVFRRNTVVRAVGIDALSSCFQLIRSNGTMENCRFEKNEGETGGVLYSEGSELKIIDTNFTLNSARRGGAIVTDTASRVTFSRITADGNRAVFGGFLTAYANSNVTFEDSFMLNNTAEDAGGAVYLDRSAVSIERCIFEEGHSLKGGFLFLSGGTVSGMETEFRSGMAESGGAITARFDSQLDLQDVRFRGNNASNLGGALYLAQASLFSSACSFDSNHGHQGAGAVYSEESACRIEDGVFRMNSGTSKGGSLYSINGGRMETLRCRFERNEAEFGGALVLAKGVDGSLVDSSFENNTAAFSGGDVVVDDSNATISDSQFQRSASRYTGGALFMRGTGSTIIEDCQFVACTSAHGGCIQVESNSSVEVRRTNFNQGYATVRGGAIFLEKNSELLLTDCDFLSNTALGSGGAVFIMESVLSSENVLFQDNAAQSNGGAIYARAASIVSISNGNMTSNHGAFGGAITLNDVKRGVFNSVLFQHNAASSLGGCLVFLRSTAVLASGTFAQNHALSGGALYLYNSSVNVSESKFLRGTSETLGGFVFADTESRIALSDVSVTNGSSTFGGAVMLNSSHLHAVNVDFTECRAERDGAVLVANGTSTVLCSESTFLQNQAKGRGGALSVASYSPANLAIQFDKCIIRNNSADCGGALNYVAVKDPGTDCGETGAPCTFVTFSDTVVSDNKAAIAGGAILTTDVKTIRLNCFSPTETPRYTFYSGSEWESLTVVEKLTDLCPDWTGNKADEYGPILASYARAMRKSIQHFDGHFENTIGNYTFIKGQSSGQSIPTIDLELVDEFGQGTAVVSTNFTILAVLSSPGPASFINGDISLALPKRLGSFVNISGIRPPGNYRLQIDFNLAQTLFPTFVIDIEIRNCSVGEESRSDLCVPCNGASFSLHPNSAACQPCPQDADCSARLMQPNNGHWHRTPCSVHVQRCLTPKACDFENRPTALTQFVDDIGNCDEDQKSVETYEAIQCKEGHRGPLCGSCRNSYGKSQFVCEKCFNEIGSFFLVFLSFLVLLGLAAFTLRSNLATVEYYTMRLRISRSRHQSRQLSIRTVQIETINGDVDDSSVGGVPTTPEEMAKRAEMARWKTVEIFKITVNYLQVTAAAVSINVQWTAPLKAMFETADFMGGATSAATTLSLSCLFPDDAAIPRSILATIVEVFMPLTAISILALLCELAHSRYRKNHHHWLNRTLLSANAVFYVSYISLTKTITNILNCIEVYDHADPDRREKTTDYWAVDTNVKCYHDSHAVLVGVIGWPCLILFCAGFPFILARTVMTSVREDYREGWIYDVAGFLYRSYRQQFVYWESMIMVRKAALAAIVVFAYPLGPVLQEVLAVFVLALALYFQTIFRPFREEFDILNELEGLSLLSSLVTFVSALLFDDDRISQSLRIIITLTLVLFNGTIFLMFLSMFMVHGSKYLEAVLYREGIPYKAEGGTFHVLHVYFVDYMFSNMKTTYLKIKSLKFRAPSRNIHSRSGLATQTVHG